jgi:hypothetical protein
MESPSRLTSAANVSSALEDPKGTLLGHLAEVAAGTKAIESDRMALAYPNDADSSGNVDGPSSALRGSRDEERKEDRDEETREDSKDEEEEREDQRVRECDPETGPPETPTATSTASASIEGPCEEGRAPVYSETVYRCPACHVHSLKRPPFWCNYCVADPSVRNPRGCASCSPKCVQLHRPFLKSMKTYNHRQHNFRWYMARIRTSKTVGRRIGDGLAVGVCGPAY